VCTTTWKRFQEERAVKDASESTMTRKHRGRTSFTHCTHNRPETQVRQTGTVTFQFSTVKYSTVQYSTAQYSTISTVQYITVHLILPQQLGGFWEGNESGSLTLMNLLRGSLPEHRGVREGLEPQEGGHPQGLP